MKPYWFAYLFGGNYRGGWRPSLYRHIRKYYREQWWLSGYTLTDWVLGRPQKYFRRKRTSSPLAVGAVARPDGSGIGTTPRA